MTQEQKAKAYDEAIRKAKITLGCCDSASIITEHTIYDIFPELKESEDEKIRKELIDFVRSRLAGFPQCEKYIAWLEKQGKSSDQIHYWTEEEIEPIISDYLRGAEHYGGMIGRLRCLKPKSLEKQSKQNLIDYNDELKKCRENPLYFFDKYVKLEERKPADKVEPKFKVGDWVIDRQDIVHQIANVIENVTNHTYGYDIVGGGYFNDNTEDVRLWTIKDAKDGDVLAAHECYVIFKEIDGLNIRCYCTYHYMGYNPSFYVDTLQNKTAFHPATKEQCDTLETAMTNAGYRWDKEKLKLEKI